MPSRQEWNWYEVMLVQALVGAITANIRMIVLRFTQDSWVIEVTLCEANPTDDDEMNDVADEMSIFIEDVKDEISDLAYKRIMCKTTVSADPLTGGDSDVCRIVYRRPRLCQMRRGPSWRRSFFRRNAAPQP